MYYFKNTAKSSFPEIFFSKHVTRNWQHEMSKINLAKVFWNARARL